MKFWHHFRFKKKILSKLASKISSGVSNFVSVAASCSDRRHLFTLFQIDEIFGDLKLTETQDDPNLDAFNVGVDVDVDVDVAGDARPVEAVEASPVIFNESSHFEDNIGKKGKGVIS